MLDYSIVIPTYNRCEQLLNLLCSIQELAEIPKDIIVVDDASTDDTKKMIETRFPRVKYYQLEREMWTGFAISYGIAKSESDLVYIIDDDNVVDHTTVAPILEIFESDVELNYGVIGPVSCWYDDPEKVMYAGASYARFSSISKFFYFGKPYSAILEEIRNGNKLIQVDGIPNAFMVRRKDAIKTGLIPRHIPLVGEDGYMIYSIKRKLDHKVVVCLEAKIYHDYKEAGKLNDTRLYYGIRSKILFIKELFPFYRSLFNLACMPIFVANAIIRTYRNNNKNAKIKLILEAYKDGILGIREGKFL